MITVTAKTSGGARNFLVQITTEISNRKALNEALANRLKEELQDHFRQKNTTPNRLGGSRTNFWNEIAEATGVADVTDNGASVTVAEQRFNIHFYGGTIKPKGGRKALTIPIIGEAHGESVASYQRKTGNRLFTVPGKGVLFEKTGEKQIRPVFALRKSVTIKRDPDALPTDEKLAAALTEEANDFITATTKGGLA